MPKVTAQDETDDLMKTLVFTLGVIVDSDADSRSRIAEAYSSAKALAASIPLEDGSARPRIVACLELFRTHKEAGRVDAAAWMLTAVQERIGEKNLPEWEKLQIVADKAAQLLEPKRSLH